MDQVSSKFAALKRAARNLIPDHAYRRAAATWHLRRQFSWVRETARQKGWPKTLFHFGVSPGDDLLCTAVIREWTLRGGRGAWMMSNFPEFYPQESGVAQVVPVGSDIWDFALLGGAKMHHLAYVGRNADRDGDAPPTRHLIAELCARTGLTGEVALRPYLELSETEKREYAWAEGMVAVQSSGMTANLPMQNKQWFPERYQEVIDRLKFSTPFIQVGSAGDPQLSGARDFRGKASIRQTAALLANCRLFVGNVGFLMHLARAVECPAVILYGGREAPWQSGYTCNKNLYSPVPCAPCWLWNRCDHERICMTKISGEFVVDAIQKMLARPRNPLAVDHAII